MVDEDGEGLSGLSGGHLHAPGIAGGLAIGMDAVCLEHDDGLVGIAGAQCVLERVGTAGEEE